VQFDTSQVPRGFADDRGHVLVEAVLKSSAGEDWELHHWYDVSPYSVVEYEGTDALGDVLAAAVHDGATRFLGASNLNGLCVAPGERIWRLTSHDMLSYFQGGRWDSFGVPLGASDRVYESAQHGVLIRTRYPWVVWYTYDKGQFVQLPYSGEPDPGSRWLLGARGLQPFESELLEAHPELYAPVQIGERNRPYLLTAGLSRGEDSHSDTTYAIGDQLPQFEAFTPGYYGGFWARGGGDRIFGGRYFRCDFADTPLAGVHEIELIIEDRERNLWVDAGTYGGARHVFLKRLHDFRLKVHDFPAEVKRAVCITADPLLPGLDADKMRLFWRFEGGSWQGGDQGNSVKIAFSKPGSHSIELLGMDRQGGTSERVTLAVKATVPLPETRLVEDRRFTIKDVVWAAPVELVPTERDACPQLSYRIDSGQWQAASEDHIIPVAGLEPGKHVIELAAVEEEFYRDLSPLRLRVRYAPDFNFIVQCRLDMLACDDRALRDKAFAEIRMAGPEVIPILEEKLREAREAMKLVRPLEGFLRQIQREQVQ